MMCAYHHEITTVTAAELLLVFLQETDPAKTGAAGPLPPALEDWNDHSYHPQSDYGDYGYFNG